MNMIQEIYCKGCTKKINNIPFVGEIFQKFEDGTYCQVCSKIKVDKQRKNL